MIAQNVPLAPRCTFELGGNAAYFAEPATLDEARRCFAFAREHDLAVTLLGGGSNCLFADRGLPGFVLSTQKLRGIETHSCEDGSVCMRALAGEPFDDCVRVAVQNNWQGIECLSGIPGLIGAAAVQNIGAYGQEIAHSLQSVTLLHPDGQLEERQAADCAFGYRQSCFKTHPGSLIYAITLRLTPGGICTLRNGELSNRVQNPSDLCAIRDAVLEIRRSKSLCANMDDENHRCAGSFFTNPTVTPDEAERLLRDFGEMPQYPADGRVKLSAAWLIDHAGFHKGYGNGPVGLSTKHTLAIVNRGNATSAQVLAFALEIRSGVFSKFGVNLTPEVNFMGFTPEERATLGL